MYPDFLGIDIWPKPEDPRTAAEYLQFDFINTDLKSEWINNCEEVVALHIIEHLEPKEGEILLKRIYQILKPGAKAYVSCPDLKLFCERYLAGDYDFYKKESKPGRPLWIGPTLADKLNYQIHQNTHKWSYDLKSLTHRAELAGITNIEPLPLDHFWSRRPDHECGIIITK